MSRFKLAQANPFHPEAVGVKYPDANSTPSCSIQCADTITLVTNASGGTTKGFRPVITGSWVDDSGTMLSWSAAFGGMQDSSRKSSITSNFNQIRPVAHGIRLTSALSPNSVTGFVHVSLHQPNMFNQTTWDFPTSVAQMCNAVTYKKIPLAVLCTKALTFVNRTVDFSSERYFDPSSDLTATGTDLTFQNTGWGVIIVAIEGAPASQSVVQVEQLVHYEAIPLKSGVADASPAARFSPTVIADTTDFVNNADPIVITDQNENQVLAERGFLGGMYDAVSDVASRNAYAAGRTVANAAMGYAANAIRGGGGGVWLGNPNGYQALTNGM